MLDQMQVSIPVPLLSALLKYPEFREGLRDAPEVYVDNDYESLSTEGEMIEVVERNLTLRARQRDQQISHLTGTEPPPYLYMLGLVLGLVNEGLVQSR